MHHLIEKTKLRYQLQASMSNEEQKTQAARRRIKTVPTPGLKRSNRNRNNGILLNTATMGCGQLHHKTSRQAASSGAFGILLQQDKPESDLQ